MSSGCMSARSHPDYASLYAYDPRGPTKNRASKFGMPEFYYVNSLYGALPYMRAGAWFQEWHPPGEGDQPDLPVLGTPEYPRIKRAMRDTLTAHGDGPKLLDRSVQPVYKMKDLASTLSAEGGDDIVMKRLELIDLARGILEQYRHRQGRGGLRLQELPVHRRKGCHRRNLQYAFRRVQHPADYPVRTVSCRGKLDWP